ncbi:Sec16_C domain-containing protein/Sec16 domain-containing protein [Cephalotus follicularis]|uniref:Protein transport protein sec16 n=1 Tax=Cephalotus follicularis TaxID=3775 RepID=A0A1Q3D6W9_CEPFO|nr:Sec16_C domain-containing protein/Sec16 domain-containing protein [Cephalotus follicularis]
MASNPPFHVEDQTDEDFFDKLVDDDFDGPTTSESSASVMKFVEDGDAVKAFANLSIAEDSCGEGEKNLVDEGAATQLNSHPEFKIEEKEKESNDSLSSSELSVIYHNNEDGEIAEAGQVSDSTVDQGNGSGVKEVGWNSFHADSVQNGHHGGGFGSYSDFFNDLGESSSAAKVLPDNEELKSGGLDNSVSYGGEYQENKFGGANGEDLNSSQYWENMYPGWKYDSSTGQWYQVESYDVSKSTDSGSNYGNSEVSYLQSAAQNTSQSVVETVNESSTTEIVSNWNLVSQNTHNGYPEHMVFDPQYPGWYYDTIGQEWQSLESYNLSVQSSVQASHQQNQNGFVSSNTYYQNNSSIYGEYGQADTYGSRGLAGQNQHGGWGDSYGDYNQSNTNIGQPETVFKSDIASNFGGSQQFENSYGSKVSMNRHVHHHSSVNSPGTALSYDNTNRGHGEANGFVGPQNFFPISGNLNQQFNQIDVKKNEQLHFSNDFNGSQKPVTVAQHSFQSGQQFSYAANTERSSAGRPPHALVTFGFGGKILVMKDNSSLQNTSFQSQESVGGSISVLNVMEVVMGNADASNIGGDDYFRSLCQQSFPGPLVGGNVGSKELNKWIDERIANCGSPNIDYRKVEVLRLLLSLLKIACQHYGKLRSPFGTDNTLRESDTPESAVAKLFASAKKNAMQYGEYGAPRHCLQRLPSEGQLQATASEVQNFLVSGRKREALQCAQEGQLWGPALVLASQLGDQFYVDTVKQMALHQLVAGSPLRTLSLLIAGQPADVFSTDTATESRFPGTADISQQPVQFGNRSMLENWEENLSVITANRTKDDELVIIHLGDSIWKETSEIIAAHICYLVAEANFESYSDRARLCLIGSDHWKFPRTYASPEAIQRTEFYEYSKVLGNSQFILLPFQPYKLMYAHMLAEVGKVSDSLKYCQALLKSLKTGRAPEVETLKQLVSSLEERIRTHQQGGYAANLVPAKLVGKLLNFFDSTAHRVVGGLPPPVPSSSHGNVQGNIHYQQPMGPRVSASQSTMAMSSLIPSASMEPISEWAADGNRMTMSSRSVSEPDFGRSPRQVESSKAEISSSTQGKSSGGASRFARFGFGSQLLQKTVGLVLRPRSDRQAKLGETNKFYYDEKLKRWVEEGAEVPTEEAALPPPPKTAAFQNGMSDYNLKSALKSEGSPTAGSPKFSSPSTSEHTSGIPPIPSGTNQFSARGRMGVRSRYVDTFNQSTGSSAKLFTPSVPSVKPAVAANAKFFIPTPSSLGEQTMDAISESLKQETTSTANPLSFTTNDSFQTPIPSSPMTMQRFPSMGNIAREGVTTNGNGPLSSHSRRTLSWSGGSFDDPKTGKPLGEVLGMPASSAMPRDPSLMRMAMNGGSFGDLHEVEL